MRKSVIAALSILLLLGMTTISAEAQPRVQPDVGPTDDAFVFVGPEVGAVAPQIPFDWHVVPLWGEVWANGHNVGVVDFFLFWQTGGTDPVPAQLWALWRGQPVQVCVGDIFETPRGEPIFFGDATGGGELEATCQMARTPDHDEISLFIATEDGQWANSLMSNPNWHRTDAASIFG